MTYKYWLPDQNNNSIEHETEHNSVIIIGANGSGKSKLGAWIEQKNFKRVHRIAAQRKLSFKENIQLKNYAEAENLVFYGEGDARHQNKGPRWEWGHYTTKLVEDFDDVLAALLALTNNEVLKFHNECRLAGNNKHNWPDPPITEIDKLQSIWKSIFPHRNLIERDSKFFCEFTKNGIKCEYSATDMSDGERSVLYLTAQVLCVPKNTILIFDEPELHIHKSIMNYLWKSLEKCRQDCLFIYITHDLNFASGHGAVDKFWIKEYDGEVWDINKINSDDFPEELTLQILGNRKNVLFVEGERNSCDFQLYTQLFPDYLVIPCGGCSTVIERTKVFKNSPNLHDLKVYGLIDRDYKSEQEIESLKNQNVYTLDVAEVENLFIVEELMEFMARRSGVPDIQKSVTDAKDFVINTKYANMIERQLCQSVVAELKYQLSIIEIKSLNENQAKEMLDSGYQKISYDNIRSEKEQIFKKPLEDQDYKAVLRVFNEKGIAKSIGKCMGIFNNSYMDKVITLLNGECHDEITEILGKYLPNQIPR